MASSGCRSRRSRGTGDRGGRATAGDNLEVTGAGLANQQCTKQAVLPAS